MSGWDGSATGADEYDFSVFSKQEGPEVDSSVEEQEELVAERADDALSVALRERDDYLNALRHLQADFENYKKRVQRQQAEQGERAVESLVAKLLPVLDTADLALAHGAGEEVKQISDALQEILQRQGLGRVDAAPAVFDPTIHDAVSHEPADEEGEPQVIDVMRAGYLWNGRVLRPAMVRVRG